MPSWYGAGLAPGGSEPRRNFHKERLPRMPARIRLTLLGPATGPHRHADGLRAVALAAIRRAMPSLAAAIHDANQPNPLTVGPLLRSADDPQVHTVELGCIADAVVEPLLHGLPRPGRRVLLGRTPYDVGGVDLCAKAAFEDLASSPAGAAIPVRLLTPTAHHAPGAVRRSVVVPDPALYFGSWFRRWNLYGPAPFAESLLDAVAAQMAIRCFEGGTRAVRLDRQRVFIGFAGRVEFAVLDGPTPPDQIAAAAWALARLAEYCGTGVETMRGMGQTRLESRAPGEIRQGPHGTRELTSAGGMAEV